jgi:hypothetical protein
MVWSLMTTTPSYSGASTSTGTCLRTRSEYCGVAKHVSFLTPTLRQPTWPCMWSQHLGARHIANWASNQQAGAPLQGFLGAWGVLARGTSFKAAAELSTHTVSKLQHLLGTMQVCSCSSSGQCVLHVYLSAGMWRSTTCQTYSGSLAWTVAGW